MFSCPFLVNHIVNEMSHKPAGFLADFFAL